MKTVIFRLFSITARKSRSVVALAASAAVPAFITAIWPHAALAQAATVGDVLCNVANEINGGAGGTGVPMVDLFSGIAYLAGTVLIGVGLLQIKEASDQPGRPPLYQPIIKLVAAAALLSLPTFTGWCIKTLFTTPAAGGTAACTAGTVTPTAGAAAGVGQAITNFSTNIQGPLNFAISIFAITIGVFLIVRGLLKASKYGTDPRASSVSGIVANLMVGAILVTVGQSAGVILQSIFGTSTIANSGTPGSTIVAGWTFVTTLGASTDFINAIAAGLDFFQLVGMIAFVRGFMIVKSAVEGTGQATMAQGFTHILGGALAINIYTVLQIFDQTLGTGFL